MNDGRFDDLAAAPCAAGADLLIALAAHLGTATGDELHARLDDEARRLFGVGRRDPAAQAHHLAAVMDADLGLRAALGSDCSALMLDRVLASGRGHPVVLASIGADLCRRAGLPAGVYSSPERWFIGLGSHSGPCCSTPPCRRAARVHPAGSAVIARTRSHSASSPGSRATTPGADATRTPGTPARLRLALPIDDEVRASVQRELDELEDA